MNDQNTTNNQSNSQGDNLTPAALAAKCKEETITTSIRMKERTNLFFNYIAQKYNAAPSSLINGVLDNYVKLNTDDKFEQYLRIQQIITALTRRAKELAGQNDEELFNGTNGAPDFFYDFGFHNCSPTAWLAELDKPGSNLNEEGEIVSVLRNEEDVTVVFVPHNIKTCIIHKWDSDNEDSKENSYIDNVHSDACMAIEIPHRKWLLVDNLLVTLSQKYRLHTGKDLFFDYGEAQKFNNSIFILIDSTPLDDRNVFLTKIVDGLGKMLGTILC